MLRPSNKYRRNYVAAATEPQIQDLKTIISTIAALVAAAISAATLAVVIIVRRPPACRTLNWDSTRPTDALGAAASTFLFHNVEFDLLAISKALESVGMNGRVVSKAVGAAIVGDNESKALLGV